MSDVLENQLLEITEIFSKGQVDEAFERMAALEQACQNDRERSRIMSRYVTFFHLLEMEDEELSALAQALLLDRSNPRANYLNAVHLMSDERWDDAITALNTASQYYPPDDRIHLAEVYGNLSYCWEALGDKDRAQMYLELSEELDPNGPMGVVGEPGAEWPEDIELLPPDPDEALDALDGDDLDGRLGASSRLDRMLQELGARGGKRLPILAREPLAEGDAGEDDEPAPVARPSGPRPGAGPRSPSPNAQPAGKSQGGGGPAKGTGGGKKGSSKGGRGGKGGRAR